MNILDLDAYRLRKACAHPDIEVVAEGGSRGFGFHAVCADCGATLDDAYVEELGKESKGDETGDVGPSSAS